MTEQFPDAATVNAFNTSIIEEFRANDGKVGGQFAGADLLLAAPTRVLSRYRIVGDPLARLSGAAGSEDDARQIFAPTPDDLLPVIPLDAWADLHSQPQFNLEPRA